jgi:hypothetical protein
MLRTLLGGGGGPVLHSTPAPKAPELVE